MKGICVPKQTENLLHLSPLYRDYFGELQAEYARKYDWFAKLGCFEPRFYHAPSSETQFNGIAAAGYLTYLLSLPIGSFLIGYLHTTSSAPNSAEPATNPVPNVPPNASGFSVQITDLALDHKFFSHPVPEAYFINDNLLGENPNPPYINNTQGYTFPSFPRLLPVPYPIVPPGQLQVEFWNSQTQTNTDAQLTFLVLVPDGGNQNARSK